MTGLLIYDGDCGFCTSTAAWMLERFKSGVQVASWQQLDLDLYGLTAADGQSSSWWVDDAGEATPGAMGVGKALTETEPRWTRLAGAVIGFGPVRPLAKATYRLVVRYRHKLPGSTDACRMRYDTSPE